MYRIPRIRRWLALPLATFMVSVTCRDGEPTAPVPPIGDVSPVVVPPTVSASVVTAAASEVLVGAGNIANCDRLANAEATARLLDGIEGTVFTTGDNAYRDGSAANYADCYQPTWGRHKARTRPAPGDRDYRTSGASGYFGYFGAAAGDPAKGYYSYDLGDWHVVVLNTKLPISASSAQVSWLQGDLEASARACTAVIMHRPYYSSVTGVAADLESLWSVLYARGVEFVLSSDDVTYERFAMQDASSTVDAAFGVRQFIVGTGGGAHQPFGTILPNSEARSTGTYGVLKLTLGESGYQWQFVPVAGKVFAETGSGSCHGSPGGDPPPPPPVADAGGPYTSADGTGKVTFDGSGSSDPQGDLPLTYAWEFGDGSTGTGATPTHTYAANDSYTVSLVVTDADGNTSAPATTTAAVSGIVAPPTTGALTVTAATSGASPDPDGYQATVHDEAGTTVVAGPKAVGVSGSASFPDLSAGTYTVKLSGIAANCSTGLADDAQQVTVPAGGTAEAEFAVSCSEVVVTGSITVTTTTSGSTLDPDGYTATLDPGTAGAVSQSIGISGSVSFADVSVGSHTVALTGVAANCTSASNPRTVGVTPGGTTTAAFSVTCTAPPSGTTHVLIGAGDIAACGPAEQQRAQATATAIDRFPDATVFTAGDNAYPNGRAIDYQNCYEPTWGRHKSRTWATLGNHEYDTGTAGPSFDYFGDRAGPRNKGYYSFDLGDWQVVVLNDNIDFSRNSAQDLWLQNELATSTKRCTIAIWHQPYTWSQGTTEGGRSGPRKIFWDRLYAAGAEVVIHGHRHFYERFAPMTPDRSRDDATGIRQFIIGTGGEDVWPPSTQTAANSEVLSPRGVIGVLKLTLRPDSYDWEFVPVEGQTWTDSGTGTCHD